MLDNTGKIVYKSTNGDSLVSQPTRRRLCYDGIADRSNGNHVAEIRENQDDANCQLGVLSFSEGESTNDEVAAEDEQQATHIESRSTKVGEQEPADDTTDDIASRQGDVEVEGLNLRPARGLEEGNGISHQSIAAHDLGDPDNAILSRASQLRHWDRGAMKKRETYDFRSTKIGSLEAFCKPSTFGLSGFERSSMLNKGKGRFDLCVFPWRILTEAMQASLSQFRVAATHGIPRGLGSKVSTDEERHGPNPLEKKRKSPGHITLDMCHGTNDAGGQENTCTPAHADVGGHVRSKNGRDNFRSVRSRKSLARESFR